MTPQPVDTILISLIGQLNRTSLTAQHLEAIRRAAPGVELIIIQNREEWAQQSDEIASRIQVILGKWIWGASYKELPNLKWFQQIGSGVNRQLQSPEIAASDLILTNAAGTNAIPMAEHVIAIMLLLSRGFHHHLRRQLKHGWDRTGTSIELEGTTMGLIGVGRIGEKVAEKAKGMNMKVLGLRRHPDLHKPHIDRMYGPENLLELLSLSDWVVIAAALTAETIGLIGENELKAMKPSAHIINVARGSLVQENALIKALAEGWIAGAGLDVFENEPLPEDSPLWDMDNVIITPHYGSNSPHTVDRLIGLFIENLRRYQNGHPLINVVNKQLGY